MIENRYKPEGYASVSTYIVADRAQRVVDFLVEGFGATQLRRFDLPDGSIMHAEVQIDDTVVMITDSGEDHAAFPVWLHVYVPEVDATYERLENWWNFCSTANAERERSGSTRGSKGSRRKYLVDCDPANVKSGRQA